MQFSPCCGCQRQKLRNGSSIFQRGQGADLVGDSFSRHKEVLWRRVSGFGGALLQTTKEPRVTMPYLGEFRILCSVARCPTKQGHSLAERTIQKLPIKGSPPSHLRAQALARNQSIKPRTRSSCSTPPQWRRQSSRK